MRALESVWKTKLTLLTKLFGILCKIGLNSSIYNEFCQRKPFWGLKKNVVVSNSVSGARAKRETFPFHFSCKSGARVGTVRLAKS